MLGKLESAGGFDSVRFGKLGTTDVCPVFILHYLIYLTQIEVNI
jgi:hypothetical protein